MPKQDPANYIPPFLLLTDKLRKVQKPQIFAYFWTQQTAYFYSKTPL